MPDQSETLQQLTVPRYAPRIQPTPIPAAQWNDEPLFCLRVNDEWVSHIIGVLIALDQPDAWIGDEPTVYAARQQVNEIIAAFMEECDPMSNCCPEPLTRVTTEGVLQVSYDGGETWADATTEDPRNTAPQLPPLTGDDGFQKRCVAANNVLGQFKDGIAAFEGYFDTTSTVVEFVTACAGAIVALIFAPFAVPFVVAAIIGLMSLIWNGGKSAYSAAFNDTVFGELLCILYCHCESDGTFTASGLSSIRADINSNFDSTAGGAFTALLNGVTVAGLNTMARIPTGSSADCDSCVDCPTCTQQWAVMGGAHGTILNTTEEYVEVQASDGGNGNYYVILHTPDENTCCYVDSVTFSVGGASLHGWTDCGTVPTEGVPQHTGLGFGTCVNYVQAQDANPFTIRFYFVECP